MCLVHQDRRLREFWAFSQVKEFLLAKKAVIACSTKALSIGNGKSFRKVTEEG
jgi:hypothetical protein